MSAAVFLAKAEHGRQFTWRRYERLTFDGLRATILVEFLQHAATKKKYVVIRIGHVVLHVSFTLKLQRHSTLHQSSE